MPSEQLAITAQGTPQKSDHQHNLHVAVGIDVVIRYCTICGLSHILNKNMNEWTLIKERKEHA